MNVTENRARIFMRKVGKGKKAFTRFSVTVSRKDEDGDYINATLFANLSDEAKQAIRDEECGAIVKGEGYSYVDCAITDGWLSAREGKNGDYNMVVLFINTLEPREDEDEPKPKGKAKGKGRKPASKKGKPDVDPDEDEDEEDLPF